MIRFKKGWIAATVLVISVTLTLILVSINKLNSQQRFNNDRTLVQTQLYYGAYAGIQRAIYEIKEKRGFSYEDYFVLKEHHSVDLAKSSFYTNLRVTYEKFNNYYIYDIVSTSYGNYRGEVLTKEINAKINIDYDKDSDIIKVYDVFIK